MADLPAPPAGLQLVSYADDLTIFGTGRIDAVQNLLNGYLPVLVAHLDSLYLQVAPAKSTVTLLTKETKQIPRMEQLIDVKIGGVAIPVKPDPKVLGVTFDPSLHFHLHAANVNKRVRSNTNVLKAMVAPDFGQTKESLIATYKAIGRAVIDYAAPIWCSSVSATHLGKLQAAQNAALRVALGCHKMAHVDHLHREASMLKVLEHCNLLSSQFLASTFDPAHPCHELAGPPDLAAFPRDKFKSIVLRHREWVAARLVFDPGGPVNVGASRAAIHTEVVRAAIASRGPNRVLGRLPPAVSAHERRLPRPQRCILSQLRSGFCSRTNYFRHRIDEQIPDICPICHGSPHDTSHLFDCPGRRTALNVLSLWKRPVQASRFLAFLTERRQP